MRAGRVVCCGLTTIDVTQVVERVPGPDEKVVAAALAVEVGGPAANAARTAAALGASTTLVTALGTGPLADLARAGLEAARVRVVDLAEGGEPAVSTVLVTRRTGERAVVSTNAVGRRVTVPPPEVLDGAGALLVDGHLLSAQTALARTARDLGVPVLLDGGSWKEGLDALLAHVDLAVVSADLVPPGTRPADGAAPGGGAPDDDVVLTAVAALGPTFVARSHGGSAVAVLDGGTRTSLPVPAVEQVVDTLGAGDVLHGATAAALAQGHSRLEALADGIAVASRSVQHPDALGWAAARPAGHES